MMRVALTMCLAAAVVGQVRLVLRTGLAALLCFALSLTALYTTSAWRAEMPAALVWLAWWAGWGCGIAAMVLLLAVEQQAWKVSRSFGTVAAIVGSLPPDVKARSARAIAYDSKGPRNAGLMFMAFSIVPVSAGRWLPAAWFFVTGTLLVAVSALRKARRARE